MPNLRRPPERRKPPAAWAALLVTALLLLAASGWSLWRLVTGAGAAPAARAPLRVTRPAPDFQLTTLDGQKLRLSDLRGKVVLLNFWATWCTPCIQEMPDLNALYHAYGAEHGFVVVSVDSGMETTETTRAFVQSHHLDFPVLLDTDAHVATQTYSVQGLPSSFLIDREGVIRRQWSGGLSQAGMLAQLKQVW